EEVIAACRDADAILNQYAPLGRRVVEALNRCRVIVRYGVGVNTIDLAAATEKGICVANVPDYCLDEVSDHALALLLNLARRITAADRLVKRGEWDFKRAAPVRRLRGQTVGLVGFGNIPRVLAAKLKPLGFRLIAHDPYVPRSVAEERGVTLVSLDRLCREADIVSVHAPLTAETRGMIGREQLRSMKPRAYLINTSRGPVVDEGALLEALREGWIAGAALDVVEEEPIRPDHPLLSMEQVILTPHMAWYSEEAMEELRTKAAEAVREVLQHGRYPRYLVNREVMEPASSRKEH
ncbi:MAG: C-terminal binding protein, partial [Planifilum fulgidum]